MKLLLDDKATRGHDLNANEACIFAAILKCTRTGRGWYGNYRELAAAMPFVISHPTVIRAIQKLLNLGLIEKRDEKLFALVQNEPSLVQNEPNLVQNEPSLVQNVLPPNNPPIINNIMNEKEKEQQRALGARDCEPQTPSFVDLIEIFIKKGGEPNEGATRAAINAWSKCSIAKRTKLLEAVKSGAHFKARLDWLISDFPEPQPVFLRGDEDEDIVWVKYGDGYKLCSRETMKLFGLEYHREWNK